MILIVFLILILNLVFLLSNLYQILFVDVALIILFILLKNKKVAIILLIASILSALLFFRISFINDIEKNIQYDKEEVVTGFVKEYYFYENENSKNVNGTHLFKNKEKKPYTKVIISNAKNKENKHLGNIILQVNDYVPLSYNDKISVYGEFKRHEVPRNDGNFDEKIYNLSNGISGVFISEKILEIKKSKNIFFNLASFIKDGTKKNLEKIDEENAGVFYSISLSDKSGLDKNTTNKFTNAGIGHILAISGLHISVIGLLIYKSLRKCGASFLVSSIISFFITYVYIVATGGRISSVRAVFLLFFYFLSQILGRSVNVYISLSLIATISLIINPYYIISPSFLLSYVAVFSLAISNSLYKILEENKKVFSNYFIKIFFFPLFSSFILFSFLLPINLYFFYAAPIYSILINVIVIPLASILLPTILIATFLSAVLPNLATAIIGVSSKIVEFYVFLSDVFNLLYFSHLFTTHINFAQIVIYALILFFVIFLIFHYKKLIFLFLIALGFFILLPISPISTVKKGFYISMLDIGQGDCILYSTSSNKKILVDLGSSSIKNIYERRVLTSLKYRGINTLDYLCVSHSDDDHINGIYELLEKKDVRIKNIVFPKIDEKYKTNNYKKLEKMAKKEGVNILYFKAFDEIKDDKFKMLALSPNEHTIKHTDPNSLSNVLYVEDDNKKILFTGDISKEVEENLLHLFKEKKLNLKVDILKVAHHGSNTSSGEEFLDFVKPKIAIISCGINNRYKHPSSQVIKRFEKRKIKYFITKDGGQINIDKNLNVEKKVVSK